MHVQTNENVSWDLRIHVHWIVPLVILLSKEMHIVSNLMILEPPHLSNVIGIFVVANFLWICVFFIEATDKLAFMISTALKYYFTSAISPFYHLIQALNIISKFCLIRDVAMKLALTAIEWNQFHVIEYRTGTMLKANQFTLLWYKEDDVTKKNIVGHHPFQRVESKMKRKRTS